MMSASHKCSLQLSLRWEYTGIQRNHNEIKATIRRALHITSKEKKEHINGMEWNAWCKFLCWLCCLIKTTLCFCHFIVQCARVSSDHGNSRWITNLINLLWVQVDCISLTHTGTYVIFANLIFFKVNESLIDKMQRRNDNSSHFARFQSFYTSMSSLTVRQREFVSQIIWVDFRCKSAFLAIAICLPFVVGMQWNSHGKNKMQKDCFIRKYAHVFCPMRSNTILIAFFL